jgi:hypothetical protein
MILAFFVLLMSCILVFLVSTDHVATLSICRDILCRSRGKNTFVQWASMVREHPHLSCINYNPSLVNIPSEPHFVLANHLASHYRMGSHLGMAFVASTRCRIVCFRDYNNVLGLVPGWFAAETMNQILQDEIAIDKEGLNNHQKERLLVRLIRETFARGENVLWFVDAGVGSKTNPVMRSLVKKVLEQFPDTEKQLVHLREPTDCQTFGYRRFPATKDLNRIIELRTQIVAGCTL